jgi:hypothetical protein
MIHLPGNGLKMVHVILNNVRSNGIAIILNFSGIKFTDINVFILVFQTCLTEPSFHPFQMRWDIAAQNSIVISLQPVSFGIYLKHQVIL